MVRLDALPLELNRVGQLFFSTRPPPFEAVRSVHTTRRSRRPDFGLRGGARRKTTPWPRQTHAALRCKTGIQSGANEDQDGRGQEDDNIVETQTEGARAAGNPMKKLDSSMAPQIAQAAIAFQRQRTGHEPQGGGDRSSLNTLTAEVAMFYPRFARSVRKVLVPQRRPPDAGHETPHPAADVPSPGVPGGSPVAQYSGHGGELRGSRRSTVTNAFGGSATSAFFCLDVQDLHYRFGGRETMAPARECEYQQEDRLRHISDGPAWPNWQEIPGPEGPF